MYQLGEYVWIASDFMANQGGSSTAVDEQAIIAASSYATDTSRFINLFKMIEVKGF
jgi:hypothetical protein